MVFTTWKERSEKTMEIITQEFNCDINPSLILGRRGETIRDIQEKTNTHISILRENNIIIITAYAEDKIKEAMELVNNLPKKKIQRYKKCERFNLST